VPRLAVDDNTFVHRGDVLVEIDPRDYRARVDAARAQLGLAQAQLDARVQLDIARVQYPAQYRQARAQIESADAAYRQALAVTARGCRRFSTCSTRSGNGRRGGNRRCRARCRRRRSRRAVQGARRRVADVGYGGGCEDGGCGGAERCGVAVTRRHISRV
jgi:multidrug resistance efflux pump